MAAPLAFAVILAANLEAFRAPLGYTEYRGIPEFYESLRHAGDDAVVVSMPFYASPQFHLNDRFMLASTRFWKPMLNGYSGFKPASFYQQRRGTAGVSRRQRRLPTCETLGVTHVVVDGRNMAPAAMERLGHFPELRSLADDGTLRLYLLSRTI